MFRAIDEPAAAGHRTRPRRGDGRRRRARRGLRHRRRRAGRHVRVHRGEARADPGGGLVLSCCTKIGQSAARELFLTGARFPAARAYEIGLVHAVVPAADLDATVARYLGGTGDGRPGGHRGRQEPDRGPSPASRPRRGDAVHGRRDRHAPDIRGRPGRIEGVSRQTAAALVPMIKRVLIANRGEIALRIIRACRELGIESVAVYSDADIRAPHVAAADRSVHIGPAPALESYLSIERLIAAARARAAPTPSIPATASCRRMPSFAAACEKAGLVFVGPPSACWRRWARRSRRGGSWRWPACRSCRARRRGTSRTAASPRPSNASACRCW